MHDSITVGDQPPFSLTFTQDDSENPESPWTAEIPVQLRPSDGIDAVDGTITVTLKDDSPTGGASPNI